MFSDKTVKILTLVALIVGALMTGIATAFPAEEPTWVEPTMQIGGGILAALGFLGISVKGVRKPLVRKE
jgi:mannose/fructose/N-acetylgalactosamine-specific phosphotransferase system component IIC